ncbi:MAG TPA: DUF763 domain-containing protein [Thermoplasmata archaeon]|nr:DUF763 domain-containing protein [Thermoplasmata archaeon]
MPTGIANLPLHHGKAPKWLFVRMVKLAGTITEVILDEYGLDEFLRRISNPFWFQSFGCVLGFDWHSSGLTTTVCGALKEAQKEKENGLFILGGKGRVSREISEKLNTMNLNTQKIEGLKKVSRLSAKVDNAVLQDGYRIYHHVLFFTEKGKWAVVQQGMNENWARRYHWLDENIKTDFVNEPHAAICSELKAAEGGVLNLTARECEETRKTSVDLVKDNPIHLKSFFKGNRQMSLDEFLSITDLKRPEVLNLPAHHHISEIDLTERDFKVLKEVYEFQPENYQELISFKGMGPKRIRALALVSNIIHGTSLSWRDPAKYSFAHGGKDGIPYPVDRETYDHTIEMLRETIYKARLEEKEKKMAWKRFSRLVEIGERF